MWADLQNRIDLLTPSKEVLRGKLLFIYIFKTDYSLFDSEN